MKKSFVLILFLSFFGFARENPFLPVSEFNSSIVTTNKLEHYDEFKSVDIPFENDTNLLLELSYKYRNNDGSIAQKNIQINKSIDKNAKYVLKRVDDEEKKSDTLIAMPSIPDVSVIADDNNVSVSDLSKQDTLTISGNDENETINIGLPSVDTQISVIEQENNKTQIGEVGVVVEPIKEKSEPLKSFKFKNLVKIDANAMSFKLLTDNKMIRNFLYEDKKIVLDFAYKLKSFRTKRFLLDCGAFKNIAIGWHKNGFYRVAIELDGKYGYKLKEIKGGYEIRLHR